MSTHCVHVEGEARGGFAIAAPISPVSARPVGINAKVVSVAEKVINMFCIAAYLCIHMCCVDVIQLMVPKDVIQLRTINSISSIKN